MRLKAKQNFCEMESFAQVFFSYIFSTLLHSLKRFGDSIAVDRALKTVTLNPRWTWLTLLVFLKLEGT